MTDLSALGTLVAIIDPGAVAPSLPHPLIDAHAVAAHRQFAARLMGATPPVPPPVQAPKEPPLFAMDADYVEAPTVSTPKAYQGLFDDCPAPPSSFFHS